MPDDVSLQDYIDTKISGVEERIGDLKGYLKEHFESNDRALSLANEAMMIRLDGMGKETNGIDKRVKDLETTRAFSAGKMWMVMAIFAAIPTILALIALFQG